MAIKTLSSPQAPDIAAFIDIKNSHPLLRYCQNVQLSYNQADNFGLSLDDAGELKKDARVSLRSLYVAPHLAPRHYLPEQIISAEIDENEQPNWQSITDIIAQHPRSFVLGDPGIGKTTLIHSLMLAFTNSGSNLTKIALGELVPIALILRELPLGGISNFDDLLQVHCQHNAELMQPFTDQPTLINILLNSGQALILLDGLDEITHAATRRTLGQIVLQAMDNHPACRFVISSRVVGFDQAEWLGFADDKDNGENDDIDSGELALSPHHEKTDLLPVSYLAPFSYPQAQQFISHWYQNYQPTLDSMHEQRVSELLMRIKKNDGLGRLSRIPVLLNMMCFIHARRGRLPDGRAELYQRIAETYLVSLDAARGISSTSFDYRDRCEWLSEIALTMQKNRGEEDTALLIPEQQVRDILTVKLTELGIPGAQIQAEISFLLRHFAERSGLFLPRGEGLYGFSHLSFLEYFAAKALKLHAELGELDWEKYRPKTRMIWWQETFVLFFEQVDHAKLVAKYIQNLFVEDVNTGITKEQVSSQALLAAIVMDSGVKLIPSERKKFIEGLWRFYVRIPFYSFFHMRAALFNRLWQQDFGAMSLGLSAMKTMTKLNLSFTEIDDVSTLAGLVQLEDLNLSGTAVSDVSNLAGLLQLEYLNLSRTAIRDVTALAGLPRLKLLDLNRTAVSDVSILLGLARLKWLDLHETTVSDVSTLAGVRQLEWLNLRGTPVSDVSALACLVHLQIVRE
ncbi:MAG: NACHT domain-containing protein [Methylococcales bacterium]|nr:NACHT domain-containing protein [Methylococcales bacterium]